MPTLPGAFSVALRFFCFASDPSASILGKSKRSLSWRHRLFVGIPIAPDYRNKVRFWRSAAAEVTLFYDRDRSLSESNPVTFSIHHGQPKLLGAACPLLGAGPLRPTDHHGRNVVVGGRASYLRSPPEAALQTQNHPRRSEPIASGVVGRPPPATGPNFRAAVPMPAAVGTPPQDTPQAHAPLMRKTATPPAPAATRAVPGDHRRRT